MELLLEMACPGGAKDMDWVGLGLLILSVLSCQLVLVSFEQVSSLAHLDLVTFETSKKAKKNIDYLREVILKPNLCSRRG